jgi:hypothetical protein
MTLDRIHDRAYLSLRETTYKAGQRGPVSDCIFQRPFEQMLARPDQRTSENLPEP